MDGQSKPVRPAASKLEGLLEDAAAVAGEFEARGDDAGAAAAAMLRRITADPLLPEVLGDETDNRARNWRVERGQIVYTQGEPPSSPPAGGDGGDGPGRPAPSDTDPMREPDEQPFPAGQEHTPVAAAPVRRVPAPLSRFIGRARELEALGALLEEQRLVTITGSGGCGKSRLVLEFVRGLPPEREAFLVDLATVADQALVPGEVAAAMGRQEGGIGSITASMQQEEVPFAERLAEGLRHRSVLLVLDNCDRVVAACATLVQELLTTCPDLRVLCTSREILDLDGESIQRLPSLSLPPKDAPIDPADLRAYEAVELFLQRAQAKRPDLQISEDELQMVAEICRGLDGMPYAIELAAARMGVLSPRQILERLDEQLQWLRGGRRGSASARQQTMRAMIDWSHALLPTDEQVLLRRLSVFRGGFLLEAAQEVCAGEPLRRAAILDLLSALVDKSLVETEPRADAVRYRLLDSIRRFAREQLAAAGEESELRDRHRRWYLRLAEQAEPLLSGPEQARWLDVLDEELENLRAALEPHDDGGGIERLRLVTALSPLWYVRGHLSEGKVHFDRVLAENRTPSSERITALAQSAELALAEGRLEDASRAAHEALPVARRDGNARAESLALRVIAVEAHRRQPSDRARELLLTSRNIAKRSERPWAIGMIDVYLGDFAEVQGRYEEARRWFEGAEQQMREVGHTWGAVWALRALGNFLLHQNQFAAAEERLREGLDLARHINSRQFIVLALHDLGNAAYRRDAQGAAASWFERAMAAMERLDEMTTVCLCRASMAKVYVARGDLGAARRWLGTVDVEDPLLRRPARAQVLRSWGRYLAAIGRVEEAERDHRRALELWYQLHDHRRLIEELESLALLADRTGRRARAAEFHQVTTLARRKLGLAPPPVYRHEIEALAATLEAGGHLPARPGPVPTVEQTVAAELRLARRP